MRIEDTYFVADDGRPLFWLADTAWNALLRGDEQEWEEYLEARASQGFTVIQFIAAQWHGCSNPVHGRLYETAEGELQLNKHALSSFRPEINQVFLAHNRTLMCLEHKIKDFCCGQFTPALRALIFVL